MCLLMPPLLGPCFKFFHLLLQASPHMGYAFAVFSSVQNGDFVRYFRLLKEGPFTLATAAAVYASAMRSYALSILLRASAGKVER